MDRRHFICSAAGAVAVVAYGDAMAQAWTEDHGTVDLVCSSKPDHWDWRIYVGGKLEQSVRTKPHCIPIQVIEAVMRRNARYRLEDTDPRSREVFCSWVDY